MSAPPLRLERRERVAVLTLDRPPLQILDLELLAGLERAIEELAADPALQVVFLRASGEKAFSAGVSVQDHTPDRIEAMLASFHAALRGLRALDAVCVALVDGHCLGGGMELACCCDLVLATERSVFGQPEILLGCYPPVAAALYPKWIGAGRTLELLLTGRTFGAEEAERLGFVHTRVADREALEARAAQLETALLGKSAAVARLTKRAVRAGEERPFAAALAEAERIYLDELAATEDMAEGLAAFLARRPPVWRNR